MCVCVCVCVCGPGSSVGIATELRAGRFGIESRWGRDFPPVQTGLGAHPASCKMVTQSFPRVKAAGAFCWPLTHFKCRGHGTVELYLYPPSGSHRACNGITLPLPLYIYILKSFANCAFYDVECRFYPGVLYIEITVQFYGTHLNVIDFKTTREMKRPSMLRFSWNSQMLNSGICRSLIPHCTYQPDSMKFVGRVSLTCLIKIGIFTTRIFTKRKIAG